MNNMNNNPTLDGINTDIPPHALSVYGDNESMEDFPVLKAFQQYIDAEQAKSRKRLISLGIFFSVLMFVVIGIFVVLLLSSVERNQTLNDRLIEYAMKDREHATEVEVQRAQNSAAIVNLTAKLEEMQKRLAEESIRAAAAEKARNEANEQAKALSVQKAAAAKATATPSQAELEILKLKTLLEQEKNRSIELEAQRKEAELEIYRRKNYPELYQSKKVQIQPKAKAPARKAAKKPAKPVIIEDDDDDLDDLDDIELDDDDAVSYFDEKDDDDEFVIPVDIKGKKSKWRIPNED